MSQNFASRLTRTPIAHDPDPAADIAGVFADLGPDLRGLLAGTAGSSPYLYGLMQREGEWLREALAGAPEAAILDVHRAPLPQGAEALGQHLRQAKRRVALLTALADLGGVWNLQQVTGALTELADWAVQSAIVQLVGDEIGRGNLPGQRPEDALQGAGMVALAMGKMGAGELNYSSDIDLICLFDETRYGPEAGEARASLVKVTRRMAAMLSDVTAGGYVFRTDLRLRPDASVTPVCLSMAAAENYYEAEGRTWERAAYIKARVCAGDMVAGQAFLKRLSPFVWRKHLDFAAIQDAHDMRLRIRDHRGLHGPITVAGHNMKLGAGGIREIEFFTQTRQLIAGGRDTDLRDPTTVGGLAALASKGWIPGDVAGELTEHYRDFREVEHRLQMVGDLQTHTMPESPDAVARIAHLSGASDVAAWVSTLRDKLVQTDRLTEGFFSPGATEAAPELPERVEAMVKGWSSYPCLRSDRAQAIFRRLKPTLLRRLLEAANPDEALASFDGFLAGLPTGVQVFSLFEANPQLVDLIVDIAATAPVLARHLSRNAGVLDAVIGGSFFADWPGVAALRDDLGRAMDKAGDYEGALRAARVAMREWHFRIGVHHLRGLIDAFEAGTQYAQLAEAVVQAVWPRVVAELARRHGPPPGNGAVVVGMGSLGAGRLNAGSDLDLLVIYDADGVEESSGAKPLATRPYFARLTQALVTALTAPMTGGRLYEVDMRLRPSGRQGPVATSIQSFESYQMTEAWTWEHLALTRARVLAGPGDLSARVEAVRRAVLVGKSGGETLRADVADMRRRLAEAKPPEGPLDAKRGPGRMMDVELVAQLGALIAGSGARTVDLQLAAGQKAGVLAADQVAALRRAYGLCWQVQAGLRLLDAAADLGEGAQGFLARTTGQTDVAGLVRAMEEASEKAALVVQEVLG
ncbi:glutamine-synthetase adenylyltransferase [Neogemmobacter tilapiae]|uniref:Glutamate-ammonia-ligase adenylyltransferase n=1 Tax=Neogemmobacter tilapiae TaxID=875041 RepID=A0A918WGB0_9RHOB|nr:glutamine-synthetase adenylyltransferase [Gemmobacter tilapiae]GHC43931.1 glutamate-ammonia-ligase adenylyltransferase [Gemmobacter tilapiae]